MDDFVRPRVARRLPVEAVWAERPVGLIERRVAVDAAGMYGALVTSLGSAPPPPADCLTEERPRTIEALRTELIARWRSLPPGETLGHLSSSAMRQRPKPLAP